MVVDGFGNGARLNAYRARYLVDGFHAIHADKRENEFFLRRNRTAGQSGSTPGRNYGNAEFRAEL
jgi:hypothetical protein